MVRRFAVILASSAGVCALTVCLISAVSNARQSGRIAASDASHIEVALRSGYIVASS